MIKRFESKLKIVNSQAVEKNKIKCTEQVNRTTRNLPTFAKNAYKVVYKAP